MKKMVLYGTMMAHKDRSVQQERDRRMSEALTITQKLDQIRYYTERGVEYWRAHELMDALEYKDWRNFVSVIEKAMTSFDAAGEESAKHFVATTREMGLGQGGVREGEDYFLSRGACYIIAMNGDVTKPAIAEAQRYFAIQTRQMERVVQALNDQQRVALRHRVRDHNKGLGSAAKDAGVKRYGVFHGAGIRAMYGRALDAMKAMRGITESDWLSRAGIEELAANDFRITQTKAKLERDRIHEEAVAIKAHESVASEVRAAIDRIGGTMPENLPVEPPIKVVEKRLKVSAKPRAIESKG
jgi:DNA-damage-inducible protein D